MRGRHAMRSTAWTSISLISFTIVSWLPARSAPAQPVQTVRYDLPSTPLHVFNVGVVLDFFFTPAPFAEVVKTRFHLVFDTQTAAGNFPAQDLALRLEPPIPSPTVPGELLNVTFSGGADFGWSG